jgi:hypothetical protein
MGYDYGVIAAGGITWVLRARARDGVVVAGIAKTLERMVS